MPVSKSRCCHAAKFACLLLLILLLAFPVPSDSFALARATVCGPALCRTTGTSCQPARTRVRLGVPPLRGGTGVRTVAMQQAVADGQAGAGVEVYTSLGCKFCVKAKLRLRELRVPFREVRVGDGAERAALAARAGGRTSVPQVFVAGAHLGGCDELLKEDASGALQARLDAAGIAPLSSGSLQPPSSPGLGPPPPAWRAPARRAPGGTRSIL